MGNIHTAFHAGLESCEHLTDKIPFEKVYHKHNPPPGAKHCLPTYRAHQGESNLESMHHSLAHYGNTNMQPVYADMFMLELCNIAPKPTPQYPLPHLWPPPGHTPVQQLPNFALSAVFPYSYPQAVLYPTQPVTPVSMPTPTPPFYHHWASSPALTLPAAKNTKPQQDFCCYQYWEYQMHTKFYRQSKAGHPPHSKGCPQAKKQKQKHSK